MHGRVIGEILVKTGRPGLHQRLQPHRAGGILALQVYWIDEQALPQIGPDRGFALRFGQPAQVGQVVDFDPAKIILGLRIDHAEHRIGIAVAFDMGNPPIVAGDRGFISQRRGGQGQRKRGE